MSWASRVLDRSARQGILDDWTVATFDELRRRASDVLSPRELSPSAACGTVGAAVETDNGDVFVGVCVDTSSSLGFCAEHAAAAAMLTAGQNVIVRMVAVGRRGTVLAPCGRCREFISQLSLQNLDAEVLVNEADVVRLGDLMPYRWPTD